MPVRGCESGLTSMTIRMRRSQGTGRPLPRQLAFSCDDLRRSAGLSRPIFQPVPSRPPGALPGLDTRPLLDVSQPARSRRRLHAGVLGSLAGVRDRALRPVRLYGSCRLDVLLERADDRKCKPRLAGAARATGEVPAPASADVGHRRRRRHLVRHARRGRRTQRHIHPRSENARSGLRYRCWCR